MQWKILGALRFCLAAIVLGDHLLDMFPETGQPWNTLSKFGGFSAVLGFLVISGYSIANSITQKPAGFYKRRFLRIYPLYACSILVSLIPFFLGGAKIQLLANGIFTLPNLQTIIGNLIFMQGFLVEPIGSNLAVWTLSVEWFCYLLAPLFIRLDSKKILTIIGLSSVIFAIFPYFNKFSSFEYQHYAFYIYGMDLMLLLWAWLLGFFYFLFKGEEQSKILLIVLGCLLLEQNQVIYERWGTATYVLSVLILIYSPYIKLSANLLKFCNYLGELSYPLYLFHVPTILFCYAVLGMSNIFALVVCVLITSVLFYHSVDRYFRTLALIKK